MFGPFAEGPDSTPRKAGTRTTPAKLICGAVLLAALSGAGFGVPAALGNGQGHGQAQQVGQGPPWGGGPSGSGPPGRLSKRANGGPPGQSPGQGLAGPPAQAAPNGPPGQSGSGGPSGAGPGSGHGNGHAKGHGRGHGNGRGHAGVAGAPASAAPGHGPGAGHGPGHGNGNPRGVNRPGPATIASVSPPGTPAPITAPTPAPAPSHGSSGNGRQNPHRRTSSGRSAASTVSIAPPSAAGTLPVTTLNSPSRTGLLAPSLNSSATSSDETPELAGPLAPGTASLGKTSTAATGQGRRTASAGSSTHRSRKSGQGPIASPINDPAATVIEHFINVIPVGVWIALAAALALAALAGVAALRSGRRVRIQAGEVAAVTAAALTDALTGVLNRRGFIEAAERELDRARRYNRPMALAFVDIRGLKAVNDTEGHLAGDRLLQRVTMLLQESGRTHDLVGRIGGDELGVLLAEQSAAGAAAMTQRVRARVPAARSNLGLSTRWDVTIGTASYPEDGETFEQLLAAADRRLYEQRGIHLM